VIKKRKRKLKRKRITMKTTIVVVALLFALSSLIAVATSSTCSLTPDQLKATRLAIIPEWVDRVNQNLQTYNAITQKYLSVNGSLTIDFVGTFGPRFVAIEYGDLLYTGDVTISFGKVYPSSIRWIDDNTLYYQMPHSIQHDLYGNSTGYTAGIFNAVDAEVVQFDPNSCENPIILSSITIEDPISRAVSEAAGNLQSTDVGLICFLITNLACPQNTPFQQYDSLEDCVTYFLTKVPSNSVKGLCPQPFSSKTLSCALIHLSSAFIDPTTHCPHVGKNSGPCQDRCLSDCASCADTTSAAYPLADAASNAFCDTDYIGLITPHFTCKCLDSTVSRPDLASTPGRTYCKPITCTVDSNCPVKKGTATCVNGKCVPRPGFVWDASQEAYQRRDMSVCPYGRSRIFKQDSLSYCVKPGYCLPGANTAPQCTIGGLCDPNKVSCKAIDTQDYGLPAGFPKRNWGCVCNEGYEGGLGFPCVCPAPKVERFSVAQKKFICVNP